MELRARAIVEGFITGLHRSPYHGFSVEFAEHRPYGAGDELRRLDWKVLAKTDRLYVKRYEEETNLRHYVVLDTSASMRYRGEGPVTKLEYAAHLAAALHGLLHRQRDATGLVGFDARVHTYVPPRTSAAHLRTLLLTLDRIVRDAPPAAGAAAASALADVAGRIARRSLVVVVTDLYETAEAESDLLRALRLLRHRGHEVLVFHVLDAATERHLAVADAPTTFVDVETGERLTTHPAAIRAAFEAAAAAFAERFRRGCLDQGIDFVPLDTATPYDEALLAYLAKRRATG